MPAVTEGLVRLWWLRRERALSDGESDSRKAVRIHHGEFDPGSEQTLAACLKHASRAAGGAILRERRTGE